MVSNDDYGEGVAHEGDFIVDTETTEEEEALLRRFMPDAAPERRDLASIIMAKIEEVCVCGWQLQANPALPVVVHTCAFCVHTYCQAKAAGAGAAAAAGDAGEPPIDPKLAEVYESVGQFLKHYKSGKLPRVFKIIPGMRNWEDVIIGACRACVCPR